MIDHDDDILITARQALSEAEIWAAMCYETVLFHHPALRPHYDHLQAQHRYASRQVPHQAEHLPPPVVLQWPATERYLREHAPRMSTQFVAGRLLLAEERWLKALHRWLLLEVEAPLRSKLVSRLLDRQWRVRNHCLHACLQIRGDAGHRPPSRRFTLVAPSIV